MSLLIYFTQMVVRCCNILPREVVGALTLEVTKARLDEARDNLINCLLHCLATLLVAGDWNQMIFDAFDNPNDSMFLWNLEQSVS